MKKRNQKYDKDLKLIAKSSIIVFIGVVLSKVFTYVYRITIAREFGPAEYGLFTLAIMISGWFIAFSNLGLNNGLVRYASIFLGKNQKKNVKSIFRSSTKITLITSLLAGLLLFALSEYIALKIFNEPGLTLFLKFFSLAIPFTVLLEMFLSIVLAYEEVAWYSFIHKILISSLKVGLVLLLILIGFGVYSILLSYTLALFVALLVSFFLCKTKFSYLFKKNHSVSKSKSKELFKKTFSYSWPLLFYGLIWQIFHWIDSFIIGYFKTASDVGIYNAAVPIAFLLTATTQMFMQLFFPLITKEYSRGEKNTVKELSQQVGKWVFMINLPVFCFVDYLSRSIYQYSFWKPVS